jgi:hypothetical protein
VSGVGRQVLVDNVFRPQALSIDHKARLLYWTDPTTGTIERCHLDGSFRTVVFTLSFHYFGIVLQLVAWRGIGTLYGLAPFDEYVYIGDRTKHTIERVSIDNGQSVTVAYTDDAVQPIGIVSTTYLQ